MGIFVLSPLHGSSKAIALGKLRTYSKYLNAEQPRSQLNYTHKIIRFLQVSYLLHYYLHSTFQALFPIDVKFLMLYPTLNKPSTCRIAEHLDISAARFLARMCCVTLDMMFNFAYFSIMYCIIRILLHLAYAEYLHWLMLSINVPFLEHNDVITHFILPCPSPLLFLRSYTVQAAI